jgi:hypothetical protein
VIGDNDHTLELMPALDDGVAGKPHDPTISGRRGEAAVEEDTLGRDRTKTGQPVRIGGRATEV